MSTIKVDRDRCRAMGICESHAPGYFEVNDDGVMVLLGETIDPADRSAVELAVEQCPTRTLSIVDDED